MASLNYFKFVAHMPDKSYKTICDFSLPVLWQSVLKYFALTIVSQEKLKYRPSVVSPQYKVHARSMLPICVKIRWKNITLS